MLNDGTVQPENVSNTIDSCYKGLCIFAPTAHGEYAQGCARPRHRLARASWLLASTGRNVIRLSILCGHGAPAFESQSNSKMALTMGPA